MDKADFDYVSTILQYVKMYCYSVNIRQFTTFLFRLDS